jgi:phosphonate transport system substrate-binding protein
MKNKFSLFTVVAFVLILFSACAAPAAVEPLENPQPAGRMIVIGDITADPAEVIEGTQPLADYLAAKLGDYGITGGQVRTVASMEEMAELLKNGEVDIYFDSIYPATYISDMTGGQIVLRRWRFGVDEYHAVIFASKSSGITTLDELRGQIFVMDAPYSTSGYMMPAAHLLEAGLSLSAKGSYADPVDKNEVGFVFGYDDENVLQWVLSGRAEAGL